MVAALLPWRPASNFYGNMAQTGWIVLEASQKGLHRYHSVFNRQCVSLCRQEFSGPWHECCFSLNAVRFFLRSTRHRKRQWEATVYHNRVRAYFEQADDCPQAVIHLVSPTRSDMRPAGRSEIASRPVVPQKLSKECTSDTRPARAASAEDISTRRPPAKGWCNYSI
jgi:hypothetical protein